MKEPIEKTRQKAEWGCKKSKAILAEQAKAWDRKCELYWQLRYLKADILDFCVPITSLALIGFIWIVMYIELVKVLK